MMNSQDVAQKTAHDYAKYVTNTDIAKKLEPINKSLDDLLTRLEEFETMFSLVQPDVKDSKDIIKSILEYKPEFEELCEKIDSIEFLMGHVGSNLDTLEAKIEEREGAMGAGDATSKVTERVTNIFTPLFKKTSEKKLAPSPSMELFKTEEYFK